MHVMSVGTPIPEYPLIHQILRGNARWEEQSFPRPEVRFGISAEILRRICALGITTDSVGMIRNAAASVFSYCMSGLRESSVVSIITGNVTICDTKLPAILTLVKGRRESNEQLVEYHRSCVQGDSPLDLCRRWADIRGLHARFFGMPRKPISANVRTLNRALQECLKVLNIPSVQGGSIPRIRFESARTPNEFCLE